MKPASFRAQLIVALVLLLILDGLAALGLTLTSRRPSCYFSCINPGDYHPVGNP